MNPKTVERLIYGLVIVLSLIVLGLMAFAPDFMNSQVVYQGF
jgi:hypothetical protein